MSQEEIRLELYSDEEVQAGIKELFGNPKFVEGMKKFLPSELSEYILATKENVRSIFDFQSKITAPFLKTIQEGTISELTSSGLENLNQTDKYLFISNHRDIVLDSAYLNYLLFKNNITTSQIAIGDNLMKTRNSELIFRINKSFVVKRTGSPRELYAHSINLSKYILQMVSEKMDSIWIAQRQGRAKDGNDQTQQGLLKMISLSGGKRLKEHFQKLKVVPVSISYELDPTALLKTQEFLKKQKDPEFKKSFQEDVNHMLQGIQGKKGQVHFNFGKPLFEELDAFDTAENSKQELEILTQIIDKSIHQSYRLNPINFIAFDLLNSSKTFIGKYTTEDWEKYVDFFQKQIDQLPLDQKEIGREYLLNIYANPVKNAEKY